VSRNGKVLVAMSGGVDSSVTACLLQEQGYECVGVFMRVGAAQEEAVEACASPAPDQPPRRLKHGCCSVNDALDARAICARLGMPFYALNFKDDFDKIIDYFVDEYGQARTPNPCVVCNIELKFGKLLRYAEMIDAEFVATGHYARVEPRDGQPHLLRSLNAAKDQSYVLFGIRRADLGRCLFPLGSVTDKQLVRDKAAELGLRVHDKPDSQEICFVPNNDYKQLVRERRPKSQRRGEIRNCDGAVVGAHEGVVNYTIGQRRGLALAMGYPIYVTNLDHASNTVTVGEKAALQHAGLEADRMNWLVDPPPGSGSAAIKIRHQHTPAAGRFEYDGGGSVRVHFDAPQLAVAPGQAAVLYREDDVVLGGGWIRRSLPAAGADC
jgi:tRNA-uridine 2-sulfurtransferase